ncbi:MAG: ATP-binding protein [Pseudomonadota bacterium]
MRDVSQIIDDLYAAEYRDPFEATLRLVGSTIGGLLLYLHTGWLISAIWPLAYCIAHGVQWSFLRRKRNSNNPKDAYIGEALLVSVHVSFLWLPTYLAATPDLHLSLVGTTVFIATAMFHTKRLDTSRWLVGAQIVVFGLALAFIGISQIIRAPDLLVKLGLALVFVLAIFYVAIAIWSAYEQRLKLIEAERHRAQEEKLAAIGRVAGGIAHDFNNTLAIIKGNLELHADMQATQDRNEVVDDAYRAAERAQSVVSQLLVYARKSPVAIKPVDLAQTLTEVRALSKTLVPKTITLTTHVLGNSIMANVDEQHLVTALLNLIRNAIDAIEGQGHITLRLLDNSVSAPQDLLGDQPLLRSDMIYLEIEDDGQGIPKDLVQSVTEPFFTTKDIGKGTGLGLSMVKGFVDAHEGTLVIESDPGGTRIKLGLPKAQTANVP